MTTVAMPRTEALIEAARALAPRIRTVRDQIDAERRLPPALVDAMADAGLFRLWVPTRMGGEEVDPITFIRVVEEVARVDGSAGWCLMIGAGTGSHDYVVEDVFVPHDRTLPWGRAVQPGPLYAMPLFGLLATCLSGVALGIARGAIDALTELAGSKTPMAGNTLLRDRATAQVQVARAEGMLRSARALVFETLTSVWGDVTAGRPPSLEQRAFLRLAATNASESAARAGPERSLSMNTAQQVASWKRVVMIAAPPSLSVLTLFHGLEEIVSEGTPDSEAWVRYIATIKDRWLLIHILGLALFPLLGLTVLWMLPARGRASRISRSALLAFIVLYPAFDALVGIGSAILLDYRATLSPEGQAVLDPAIQRLFFDTSSPAFWLAAAASAAWAIGAIAAAIGLWRQDGWRVGLPLFLAGLLLGFDHAPPMGTVAGLLLALAVWQFLVSEQRRASVVTTIPAPA